ncbi:LysR family transcriptional regulator [Maridesulfovibrio ferrireducens]|uniref:LysR family transcriptional regulator n=1 Tax=Maridesulfovibrio ferrireducens TaxID=246191 RepID=UPI001A2763A8|nr:LysR family transcriptional regulator [Maridesulfovibrio ferrireducens]MBI9111868.1 LysR family transcriptional regulator [Maridesulfovibrio ferrireducens]
MSKTNLSNLDLNLLVILDTVFTERSLTLAGKKLFMTQSAISHALSKLRDHFEDRLFIRRGNRMDPTPLCEELHQNLSPSLKKILQSLEDRGEFSPATSRRTFCLGLSDYLCNLLLPEIISKIQKQGPGVTLRIVQATYEQRTAMLQSGKLDIFLGCSRNYGAGVFKEKLFEDREICILRKDHPITGDVMTEDEMSKAEFVALSLSESGLGFLEDFLYRKGVQRKIKVVVQQEVVIPSLVSSSNLVGTLAERLAQTYSQIMPVRIIQLPLENTVFEIFQHWHAVNDNDPAHRWMRSIINDVAKSLPELTSD